MKRTLLVLLVASCGDNHHTTTSPPDSTVVMVDAGADAAPPHAGMVTAHMIGHYLTESGDVTKASSAVELIDSADNVVMPTDAGNGMLTFTPVAPGAYLLCDTSFVTRLVCTQSAAAALDLDFTAAGRPDAAIGGNNTSLALTVTGANGQTNPNEFLDIEALNTNFSAVGTLPAATNTPALQTLNFTGKSLLASGDILRVTQMTVKSSGSETYTAATKVGQVSDVTMTSGTANTATVNLGTTIPQTSSATFNLRRSQFAGLAGSPGNGATYAGVELDGIAEHPPYQFYPWLFQYFPGAATSDVSLNLTWGNPWPGATAQTFAATFMYKFDTTAPGATTPTTITLYTSAYRPIAELTGDIVPKLSRATALKVNNLDATTSHSGTSVTPTISWTAPTLGTANRYTLFVYRIIKSGTTTVAYVTGQLAVTGTSFRIPPGLINAGENYMIGVRAENVPGFDTTKPFATAARYELADTITALQSP